MEGDTDIQRILGQLLEAHRYSDEDRKEARSERADMKVSIEHLVSAVKGLDQTVRSSSQVLASIENKRYDERILRLEDITHALPKMANDFVFWRRIVGAGWGAVWRLVSFLAASGLISAGVSYLVKH